MTCGPNCLDEGRIRDLLAGKISQEEHEELSRQIESCAACGNRLEAVAGNKRPADLSAIIGTLGARISRWKSGTRPKCETTAPDRNRAAPRAFRIP